MRGKLRGGFPGGRLKAAYVLVSRIKNRSGDRRKVLRLLRFAPHVPEMFVLHLQQKGSRRLPDV